MTAKLNINGRLLIVRRPDLTPDQMLEYCLMAYGIAPLEMTKEAT